MAQADAPPLAAQRFIKANLEIIPVPFVPEILLHIAGPRSGLSRLNETEDANAPYWAHWWGGGLALARHVLDQPELVRGRAVLDLGAGSGIVAIAAAKAGAKSVLAVDIDPYAIAAIKLNAKQNNVSIIPRLGDLSNGPCPAVDLILAGDVFYDLALAKTLMPFFDACVAAGVEIVIGDPGRAHLPRDRLSLLATYLVPDFGESGKSPTGDSGVYRFG